MSRLVVVVAACLSACSDPWVVNITGPFGRTSKPDLSVAEVSGADAHIRVTPKTMRTTTSNEQVTFKVVLDSQPSDLVTIPLESSDPAFGAVDPEKLAFTPDNWDKAQTVTVTAIDDQVVSGDHTFTIKTLRAVSDDEGYSGLDADDVTIVSKEVNVPSVVVEPQSGLSIKFGVNTASFKVRLSSMPIAPVTVPFTSGDVTQGTVSPASLDFDSSNWNVAKTVTVTAVDDQIAGGDKLFKILTGQTTSTDPNYDKQDPADVEVTNVEINSAGIIVTPISGLTTAENGGTDSFTVRLNSKPTATVTIAVSSNSGHGTASPASLSFTGGPAGNWATPHTVTVTGVDDSAVTGNELYTIVTAAAVSTDAVYNGRNADDVTVTSIDLSVAGITLSRTSGLVTNEAGGNDTFTIRLNTVPSANVTIGFTSDNTTVGTVSPSSVTFTSVNWDGLRTITVTGRGNSNGNTADDGNKVYHVVTAAATSSDPNYNGMNPSNVTVTDQDDDITVYGGSAGDPASMVWCRPIASCSATLTVNVPFRGGTVNFLISNASAVHAVESTAASSEFTSSPLLTTGTPWPLTLGAGSHPFDCSVHGSSMSGTINVP